MKRILIVSLLCLLVAGCAGTAAEMLTYDNISAAAIEAQKGVTALDQGLQGDQAAKQQEVTTAIAKDVTAIAQKQLPEADAKALGDRVAAALTTHLANMAEQDRRRREVVEPTLDNLAYILQVCKQGKDFVLFRSSVATQWKSYLEATGAAGIKKITGANP